MTDHLIFLSIPGLRPADIGPSTPTLQRWSRQGAATRITPTFPCVTSCVQASMWTGTPPAKHGVIANGFYYRDRSEVEFWVARNGIIQGEQIWDAIRRQRPGLTSAVWHAQNVKDAAADFIVTPAPIHEPDGSTRLWCYSKPDGLYQQMLDDKLGHFPLQHYWGPLAGIQSTQWILTAARWLIERHDPNFHYIYIPHLDYAAQKYGPNSPQAAAALKQLDNEISLFHQFVERQPWAAQAVILVASEYALTDVSRVSFPNRILREAGLLAVRDADGRELVDLPSSAAFAMVDHQVAHVFCKDDQARAKALQILNAEAGSFRVYAGPDRAKIGMTHDRCGDIVLVAPRFSWFAYYWWTDDNRAPAFARTVDIHNKPGYDPVELFIDPPTRSIPLDASLVKGSHGAPADDEDQKAALICSRPTAAINPQHEYRDTELKDLVLELLQTAET